ncbi:hypothetical protein B0O80DRAFT_494161 [Mortierella sp. GBAus27b]|nr:hypothetical protein B0O80DRAFT_494161 [Mortierella sp. GBAus27b]
MADRPLKRKADSSEEALPLKRTQPPSTPTEVHPSPLSPIPPLEDLWNRFEVDAQWTKNAPKDYPHDEVLEGYRRLPYLDNARGTDYGIRTMGETTYLMESRFLDHMAYFERQADPTVQIPARVQPIPRSNKIRAQYISDISHSRTMEKRRLKKAGNDDVRRALADISLVTHSLSRATTMDGTVKL